MIVRRAVLTDAEAIARVHVAAWRTAYRGIVPDAYLASLSVDQRTRRWERAIAQSLPSHGVHVAGEAAGAIVGFASGGPERTGHPAYLGELYAIYVLEAHQRRGLGRRLTLAVVEGLLEAGLGSLLVWVLAKNHPARRFYEALGGQPVAERRIEIGGTVLAEVGYGWTDVATLATTLRG